MALSVWLHRTSNDVPAPWALELFHRCRQFNSLPGPGGAYDQDETLMMAMEMAAGVSALFDIDAVQLLSNQKRLDLHTRLMLETQQVIDYINAHDNETA